MRYQTPFVKMTLVAVMAVSVSGCASWFHDKQASEDIERQHTMALERMEKAEQKRKNERQFVSTTPWIAGASVHKKMAYPELESTPANLTEKEITLPRIVARLGDLTGINISLAPDLGRKPDNEAFQTGEDSNSGGQGQASTDSTGTQFGANPLSPQLGRDRQEKLTGLVMKPLSTPIDVAFDTSLRRALDNIASRFGISWRYDRQQNEVTLYRTKTATFQINFPGEAEGEIQVGGSDDDESVMSEEVTFNNSSGNWDEIRKSINGILSPWGNANISEATGSVSITDTPETLDAVRDYINGVNEMFSRQVYLEFRLVSVSMEDGNSFQASWDGVLNQILDGRYAAGLNSGTNALATQGSNTLNVIRNQNQASAALQLLARKAKVSQVTSRSVTTMSNQPAPIRVVRDNTYVSGVNQLQSSGNSSDSVTTEIETDTVNSGFSATLLPRTTSADRLQLQVSIELSRLVSLNSVSGSVIQTPELDRQTTVQRAWLNSGETLVMSGFSQNENELDVQGSGDESFWFFGGGRSRQTNEDVLLIMVTPYIRSGDHLG